MKSDTDKRYLWLLNTLLINGRLTFEQIAEKWEKSYLYEGKPLSLRTFHVHRNAVEDIFQISIKCDHHDGYRYFVEDTASIEGDKTRRWMLNSFNVNNLVNERQQLHDRILLEDIPQGAEYLPILISAIKESKMLEIEYQPFYEDKPTTYHVSPYCMKVYHQRWYVLGQFQEQAVLRQFSLDRVCTMKKTETSFLYPDDFSPEEYYKDVVGIWNNESFKPEEILLRAHGQQAKYLRTLPLHDSQEEVNTTEAYTDFRYHLCITNDLIHEIIAKGNAITVLQPEYLKKRILKYAWEIINRYKE